MAEETGSSDGSNAAVTMNVATFVIGPGALVKHASGVFRINEVLGLESVFARNLDSGRPEVLRIAELEAIGGEIPEASTDDVEAIPEPDWAEARARFEIIRPLIESGSPTREAVAQQAARVGKDTSTLYRWISRYRNFDAVSALLPGKRGWRTGNTRLSKASEAAIRVVIDDYYMTEEAPSPGKAYKLLKANCGLAGLPIPSATALRARIEHIPLEARMKKRGQKEAAKQRFLATPGTTPGADYPLARVEIDHTPVDVMLVDDVHRKPIGRPWITIAIDVFSRMVVGCYLSFDAPSRTSVAMCLANAMLPKEQWLLSLGIEASWPVWGRPKKFVVDNGQEFRSKDFGRSCAELNVDLEWRPVKTPRYGAHIERLQGTLLREIHDLPGTTYSNVEQRGEYDSEGRATMTLLEFERQLLKLICNEYHRSKHSVIGMPPLRKWEQGILGGPQGAGIGLPRRPQDGHSLLLHFLPSLERTIQHDGVTADGLRYFDHCLRPWIGIVDPDTKKSPLYRFKRDPRDLAVLWFFDPELKQYFRVPWVYDEASISIWEHERAKKEVKEQGFDPSDAMAVFKSIKSRREDLAESAEKTKKARLEQQRNAGHRKAAKAAGSPVAPKSQTGSEESPSPISASLAGGSFKFTDDVIIATQDIG